MNNNMNQTAGAGAAARKPVGSVTPEERDEIKRLFERRNGLKELFQTLVSMPKEELEGSHLYDKLVADMSKTTTEFETWWSRTSAKYNWKNERGHSWRIDFDTCAIFIAEKPEKSEVGGRVPLGPNK